jgi:hypothetical protein
MLGNLCYPAAPIRLGPPGHAHNCFRIQNPLHGIPKAKLLSQVDAFAREKGLEEALPFLRKGAVLAQNPKDFESRPELDEEDRAILRREITRMFHFFPADLYLFGF